MKKIIALLLALFMVVSMVGCGNTNNGEKPADNGSQSRPEPKH